MGRARVSFRAFAALSRHCLPLVLVLLCRGGLSVGAQDLLVKKDVGRYAALLESSGQVRGWENDEVKVFVVTFGGEVRQGQVRVAAPRLVVWLDKQESRRPDVRAATLRVYAEGLGSPGQQATKPARLVQDGEVTEASVICVRLRSSVGFAWTCKVEPVDELQKLGLYRRAEAAVRGGRVNFVLDTLPETPPPPKKEVLIRALEAYRIHRFFHEEEGRVTSVYLGDVRGSYGNLDLNADVAVLWFDESGESYEMYARGNVMLRKAADAPPGARLSEATLRALGRFETVRADEIYINPGLQRGMAARAEMRFEPTEVAAGEVYVIRGREVYILDSENLFMREGSITTCPFGHPHYRFTGERVRVVYQDPSMFVTGWGVKVRAGAEDYTLAGLPFLATDLGKKEGFLLASLAWGVSGKFGPFLKTRWRPTHLGIEADWIKDWLVHLDYYGSRGPGLGTELQYEFGGEGEPLHTGTATAYFVYDSGDEDDTGLAVPQTDRGRLWLRHRAQWDSRWRTDAELYWLSDSGFLNEYFEQEFESEKAPENYVFTRYRDGHFWAGLLLKMRANDFLTQLEEMPGLELQWVGVPVGPLVYDASVEAGVYDLEVSDELLLPDPPALMRVHTEHRLSAPFSVGFVRVDPFLRALATWASKGAMSGGSYTGAQSRLGLGAGVRASADFSRSYAISSDLFALNRLRHVVTPYVEFESMTFAQGDSTDFIQLGGMDPWPRGGSGPPIPDDRIDGIREGETFRVGLRQRFQTKRPGAGGMRTVDWIALNVAYVSRPDDPFGLGRDDDYVDLDFVWRLRPGLTLSSRDNRLSLGGGTSVYNLGAEIDLSDQSHLALNYHYVSDLSSAVVASYSGRLSDRYALKVLEKFELNSGGTGDSENMETQVILRRLLHKWILDLGVRYSKSNDDFSILVGFSPIGLDFWQW